MGKILLTVKVVNKILKQHEHSTWILQVNDGKQLRKQLVFRWGVLDQRKAWMVFPLAEGIND